MHKLPFNNKGSNGWRGIQPSSNGRGGGDTEEAFTLSFLSFGEVLRILGRRLWVIMLVAFVLVGAMVAYSLTRTPIYEASIKILIAQKPLSTGSGSSPDSLGGEVQGLQQLTQTMAEAVNTRPVAADVIKQLNLQTTPEDLLRRISVQRTPETQFIEVRYDDPSPQTAMQVANAIGDSFSNRVSEVSPSANAVTATVWEPATVPVKPVSPNLEINVGLALAVGLMLGIGLALVLEYLDDRWSSPEEAEQISGVPTFGVVPEFGPLPEPGRK